MSPNFVIPSRSQSGLPDESERGICSSRILPQDFANDEGPTTNDLHMLNQGVIHTYLMWNMSRMSILMGSATIVSRKTIRMEYCKRLMRW